MAKKKNKKKGLLWEKGDLGVNTNITGDKGIGLFGKFGIGKEYGKRDVGAIKTKEEELNKTTKGKNDIYKNDKGEIVSEYLSEVDTTNKYKGKKDKLGADKGKKLDRIEKRVGNRIAAKEERKNYRAAKLAKRAGMSPDQAKDFMQNRRTRFNQAVGEFGRALGSGGQMDWGKLDKRLYRKNPKGSKGPGTLQAVSDGKGGTYDATAPYKGTKEKGYADRGMARDEPDNYTKILGPKVNIKPLEPLKLNAFGAIEGGTPGKKKEVLNKKTKEIVDPNTVLKEEENADLGNDQPVASTGTTSLTFKDPEGIYTKKQLEEKGYSGQVPEKKSWWSRLTASNYEKDVAEQKRIAASKFKNDTQQFPTETELTEIDFDNSITGLNNSRFNKLGGPPKLDDRSTIQGNMINAKGRRGR